MIRVMVPVELRGGIRGPVRLLRWWLVHLWLYPSPPAATVVVVVVVVVLFRFFLFLIFASLFFAGRFPFLGFSHGLKYHGGRI